MVYPPPPLWHLRGCSFDTCYMTISFWILSRKAIKYDTHGQRVIPCLNSIIQPLLSVWSKLWNRGVLFTHLFAQSSHDISGSVYPFSPGAGNHRARSDCGNQHRGVGRTTTHELQDSRRHEYRITLVCYFTDSIRGKRISSKYDVIGNNQILTVYSFANVLFLQRLIHKEINHGL